MTRIDLALVSAFAVMVACKTDLPDVPERSAVGPTPGPSAAAPVAPDRKPPEKPLSPRELGAHLVKTQGCIACHSIDGSRSSGPTFLGLWDRITNGDVVFADGIRLADVMGPGRPFPSPDDYIRMQVLEPQRVVVQGYAPFAPSYATILDDAQIEAIARYIESLSVPAPAGQ